MEAVVSNHSANTLWMDSIFGIKFDTINKHVQKWSIEKQ